MGRWIGAWLLTVGAWGCVPSGGGGGGGDAALQDAGAVDAASPGADAGGGCGDGACGVGEGCATCPQDCACAVGETCTGANRCEGCAPACEGRACGPDGCGGLCGACDLGEICDAASQCGAPPAACGDGACDPADEDCATCPQDCGACCGDGQCGAAESCGTCPADCGACCGDGVCRPDQDEDCATCPADCGCPEGQRCEAEARRCVGDGPACGDGACGAGEACGTCPQDCGACCGDGACEPDQGEDCATCAADCACAPGEVCGAGMCAPPPAGCGDAACSDDESCATCPADCGRCCGDGACEADQGEDCSVCPADCGACCGDGACTPGHGEDCAACVVDCGCPAGSACDVERRICACTPACAGRVCGPDGCGGTCGACGVGSACAEGACVEQRRCGDGACDADEDCATCPADCGCEPGQRCGAEGACECAPSCAEGQRCGPDGCGGLCGVCGPGQVCEGGQCVANCPDDCGEVWSQACSGDGFGYRVCGPAVGAPGCTAASRRIPCDEGRACDADACGGGCVTPEVLVLLDRSSSMTAGGRWAWTRAALDAAVTEFGRRARLGVRAFPGEAQACEAGPITAPAFEAGAAFGAVPAPAQDAQTPILAAFEGVEPSFGDPNEGEAVVLITDGDETCADEDGVVARVEALRARGIRTFAVGISRQANGELLDRVAVAGGTATDAAPRSLLVQDEAELAAALAEVHQRLEICPCAAGDLRCDGDTQLTCAPERTGFEPAQACDFGCDPATTACRPVCRPGGDVYACEGDTARACNAAGTAFDGAATACEFGCGAPGGCYPVCRPGATRCVDGATVETCDADGAAWVASPCPDLCVLSAGACGVGGLCQPGDVRCADPGMAQCDAQGVAFEAALACPGTCQTQHGRCPVDQLGDAYEQDGVLYVRGPDGWGGVVRIDDWGETLACFGLGYGSGTSGATARRGALQGAVRYTVTCDRAGWLGTCQFQRSNSRDGLALGCGARRRGSAYCLTEDVSFAYLGSGVFRPYACDRGCDPEPGVCVAQAQECQAGVGACPLNPHEMIISRSFGPGRTGTFTVAVAEPTEVELAAYGVALNPNCEGTLRARLYDAADQVVSETVGGCSSVFGTLALEPGQYRLVLDNPNGGARYDLRVALPVRGPLGDALP